MRILFLAYHGFSEYSGISKKIHSQVKGLRENGHDVRLCHYGFSPEGHRCRYVDDRVIQDYGLGRLAAIRQRLGYRCVLDYCLREGIELVYARSFHNASPWLVSLFRKLRQAGIPAVTEIPTYPYDAEYTSDMALSMRMGFWIDRLFRHSLARQMSAIVTFSDAAQIFGRKTIRISNGVDFDSTPLHAPFPAAPNPLHLIGVAEVHSWHGFDRLIAGMGLYYQEARRNGRIPRDVCFHIVGGVDAPYMYGNSKQEGFQTLVDRYGLHGHVIFHGPLFGTALDSVFARCQLAIGSLARHRSGITHIKTLKNREYATRGIPFVYSECDSDFDTQPYVLKVPADETPIDIGQLIRFADSREWNPGDIRRSVARLSWKVQMGQVVSAVAALLQTDGLEQS